MVSDVIMKMEEWTDREIHLALMYSLYALCVYKDIRIDTAAVFVRTGIVYL
jgi:hypothetical protein